MTSRTRIVFTTDSALELKTTITACTRVLNELFWGEIPMKIYDFHGTALSSDQVSNYLPVEPFKPKRTKLLNDVSKLFGYKNWREIETVSKTQSPESTTAIYLADQPDIQVELRALFEQGFYDQYRVNKDSPINPYFLQCVPMLCDLVTNAIVLNANSENGNIPVTELFSDESSLNMELQGNSMIDTSGKFLMSCGFEQIIPDLVPLFQRGDTDSLKNITAVMDKVTLETSLEMLTMYAKHISFTQGFGEDVMMITESQYLLGEESFTQPKFKEWNSKLRGIITLNAFMLARSDISGESFQNQKNRILKGITKSELMESFDKFL